MDKAQLVIEMVMISLREGKMLSIDQAVEYIEELEKVLLKKGWIKDARNEYQKIMDGRKQN